MLAMTTTRTYEICFCNPDENMLQMSVPIEAHAKVSSHRPLRKLYSKYEDASDLKITSGAVILINPKKQKFLFVAVVGQCKQSLPLRHSQHTTPSEVYWLLLEEGAPSTGLYAGCARETSSACTALQPAKLQGDHQSCF